MALAETGDFVLNLMIETAAAPVDGQAHTRWIWKAMTPQAGARADVFVAHGLAALTAAGGEYGLRVAAQHEARELLWATFPWSDEEERLVQEQIMQTESPGLGRWPEEPFVWIAFHAIRFIVGDDAAAALPGIPRFIVGLFSGEIRHYGLETGILDTSLEAFVARLDWENCINHAMPRYLQISEQVARSALVEPPSDR
jgi:hypothetical protein